VKLWGKDVDEAQLPEKLRDMKPEELLAAVENSGKVTQLETALQEKDAALSATNTEVDTLKAQVARLEANVSKPADDPNKPRPIPSVLVDEDAAFAARIAPTTMLALTSGAQTARMLAKADINGQHTFAVNGRRVGGFDRFEQQIDEVMKNVPLMQQIYVESWKNAYKKVLGDNFEKLMKESGTASDYFIEGGAPGTSPPPPTKDSDILSDAEKKVAKSMGMTDAEYLKQRKEMVIVNG
jgi:hypothetical protein